MTESDSAGESGGSRVSVIEMSSNDLAKTQLRRLVKTVSPIALFCYCFTSVQKNLDGWVFVPMKHGDRRGAADLLAILAEPKFRDKVPSHWHEQ